MTPRHRATDPHHLRFPRWLRTLVTAARWVIPLAVRMVLHLHGNLTP